jgi:hypothetical protein
MICNFQRKCFSAEQKHNLVDMESLSWLKDVRYGPRYLVLPKGRGGENQLFSLGLNEVWSFTSLFSCLNGAISAVERDPLALFVAAEGAQPLQAPALLRHWADQRRFLRVSPLLLSHKQVSSNCPLSKNQFFSGCSKIVVALKHTFSSIVFLV